MSTLSFGVVAVVFVVVAVVAVVVAVVTVRCCRLGAVVAVGADTVGADTVGADTVGAVGADTVGADTVGAVVAVVIVVEVDVTLTHPISVPLFTGTLAPWRRRTSKMCQRPNDMNSVL